MNKIDISDLIKKRQQRNNDLRAERIKAIENQFPEYSDLIIKRNDLLGQAALYQLSHQDTKVKENELEVEKLDQLEKEILKKLKLPENYLDDIYHCDLCKDKGYLDNGEMCSCIKKILRQEKYKNYDLSESFKNDTFENFNMSLFSTENFKDLDMSPNEAMHNFLEIAFEFCDSFPECSDSFFIHGDVGVGKTFFVSCIVNELINKDVDIIYLSAPNFLNYLYDDVANRSNLEGSNKDEFKNVDLLVIDDLGTENTNNFSLSALSEIIDYRIINNKSTIITSNYQPSFIMQNQIYPKRMASRILAHYKVLPFIGNDLRVNKK